MTVSGISVIRGDGGGDVNTHRRGGDDPIDFLEFGFPDDSDDDLAE